MSGRIRAEREGALGWLVFSHPERRNAISIDMWRAIPEAVRTLEEDEAVRALVLRGEGEAAFVSGADISEFGSARTGAKAAADYEATTGRAFEALAGCGKPVFAMVHGYCVGGGMAIALAADLRYAADDARFAIPAARLGLGYHAAGLETLRALVGPAAAKEILFTARRYGPEEALRMGLVNAVHPKAELEARVRETADRVTSNAPLTLRSVKTVLRELAREPGERDGEAVQASIRACFESEDYREGVRAFLEKRAPAFRGR